MSFIAILMIVRLNAINENELLITEIMYNPPESGVDQLEFIKVTNVSERVIDLEGISLRGVTLNIDTTYLLGPNAFVLFCEKRQIIDSLLGIDAIEWETGSLSNSGETLSLINANGQIIDSVAYRSNGDWPREANGQGYSLFFCPANSMSNDDPSNWFLGQEAYDGIDSSEVYLSLNNDCLSQLVNVSLVNKHNIEFSQYISHFEILKEGLFEVTIFDLQGKTIFYSIAKNEKIIDKAWIKEKYIIVRVETKDSSLVKKLVL